MKNPYPKCPECNDETYITADGFEYINVWCTNEDCEWFAEVDIEGEDFIEE